jgi:hypothetical protein
VTEVIDVGDVDGDGRLDVLARVSDRLAWLRQDQNGLFEAIAIHPMRFRDQRLADVDGDGDLDILSETSWLENLDGVGRFAYPSRSLALEPLVEVFEVLDLDRDGDLDLLGRDAESRLVVKLQRPGEQDLTATLLPFVRSINVSHGDLDYDTQPDLIIGFDRGTYLFEFTTKDHAPELRQVIVDSGQLGQAAIARLIPNELPTLLIPQTDALTGWQYQDDAQQLELQFSLPRRSAAITELVAADLNGDSRPDIALLTNDGRAVEWQRNEGNKAFAARELLAELPFEAVQIQDIDVNRDGRLDLLIVPKTRDRLLALVQTDSSGWEVRLIASMPPEVGHGVLAVTIGDVDRDGQDEIVALWDAYTIIAYEPHLLEPSEQLAGRILFLATVSDGPNIDAMVLEVADVNGDGVPDVASPMIDYLQASDGTFSARWIQRSDSHLTDAARADLDGDGDLEVITVSDQLTILTYAPALDEYIEVRSVALEYDFAGVQAIDVDHDGDLDLLLSHPHSFSTSGSSSRTTTSLAWMENEGNLRFGTPRSIQTALGGFTVDAIDLDDDGLLELIAAARLMNTVEWLHMV